MRDARHQVARLARDAAHSGLTLAEARALFDMKMVIAHLHRAGGSKAEAARTLRLGDRGSLYRMMRRLGLHTPGADEGANEDPREG